MSLIASYRRNAIISLDFSMETRSDDIPDIFITSKIIDQAVAEITFAKQLQNGYNPFVPKK